MTQRRNLIAMLAMSTLLATGGRGFGEEDAGSPEMRLEAALQSPVQVDFDGMPLRDALVEIADVHRIRVLLDSAALASGGVSDEVLLRGSRERVLRQGSLEEPTLSSALERALRQHQLAWFVDEGVLHVTTREQAESRMLLKVYDVADILHSNDTSRQPHVDEDRLAKSIVSLVRPDSWLEAESVVEVVNGLLIVRQNYSAHREIETILDQLRLARVQPNAGNEEETVAATGAR